MAVAFVRRGSALLAQTIAKIESGIGQDLPADYRAFLMESDGGALEPNRFEVDGVGQALLNILPWLGSEETVDSVRDELGGELPLGLVPIGYCEGGNMICYAFSADRAPELVLWHYDPGLKPTPIPGTFTDLLERLNPFGVDDVELA